MRARFLAYGCTAIAAAWIALALPATAAMPGLDCGKASGAVEKLVCNDEALAALDRQVTELYTKAQKGLPSADAAAQRTAERSWIAKRNACAKSKGVRACVETAYQRHIVELQIRLGELEAPTSVGLVCKGRASTPMSASFYQTEPPSVVLTNGDQQVIAFIAPSGSGSRYTADGVEYWEHHGEAMLTWKGKEMKCAIRESKSAE